MKSRYTLRYGPAVLALLVSLTALGLVSPLNPGDQTLEVAQITTTRGTPPPFPLPPEDCARLAALSEYAASLTGSLAMVETEERPERALDVSQGLRLLAVREADGTELASVLKDLADALEQYARGNPAGWIAIRAASARNARLREQYRLCTQDPREENRNE